MMKFFKYFYIFFTYFESNNWVFGCQYKSNSSSGNKMLGGNIDARIHIFSDSWIHRKILSDRKVSMLISGIET